MTNRNQLKDSILNSTDTVQNIMPFFATPLARYIGPRPGHDYGSGHGINATPVSTNAANIPVSNRVDAKSLSQATEKQAKAYSSAIKQFNQLASAISKGGSATRSNIMGLPPVGDIAMVDGRLANIVSGVMEHAFHILSIRPVMLFASGDKTADMITKQPCGPEFKFAVESTSTMDYQHTNTYSQSQIEEPFKNLIQFNTVGQARRLMTALTHGYPNIAGIVPNVTGMLGSIPQALAQFVGQRTNESLTRFIGALANDVLTTVLLGGQIDLPNIWTGAQTTMSWSFTIILRTMADPPKPTNPNYYNDIVLPLLILFRLALPFGGGAYAYLEPPYIEAKVGNWIDIKLGGITNLSISAPMNRFTLDKLPLELHITITVTDAYSIMLQKGSVVKDIPTVEDFEERLKEAPESIPGDVVDYFQNEFRGQPSARSIAEHEQEGTAYTATRTPKIRGALLNTKSKFQFGDYLHGHVPLTTKLAFNPNDATIGVTAETNIGGNTINVDLGKLFGVKDVIVPDTLSADFVAGTPIDASGLEINIDSQNFLDLTLNSIQSTLHDQAVNAIQQIINPDTIVDLFNGKLQPSDLVDLDGIVHSMVDTMARGSDTIIQSLFDSTVTQLEQQVESANFINNVANFIPKAIDSFKNSMAAVVTDALTRGVVDGHINTALSKDLKLSTLFNMDTALRYIRETAVDSIYSNLMRADVVQKIKNIGTKLGCTNRSISDDFYQVTNILADPVSKITQLIYTFGLCGGVTNDARRTNTSITLTNSDNT